MSFRGLQIQKGRLSAAILDLRNDIGLNQVEWKRHSAKLEESFKKSLSDLNWTMGERIRKQETVLGRLEAIADKIQDEAERAVRLEVKALQKELKETKKLLAKGLPLTTAGLNEADLESVKQAKTLAIYDSIIFAISNWSTDGDAAPDFELTCQAALFPTVYERVMSGESDYYLERVPTAADVVVQRGREYVKHFRNICNASLVDPAAWNEHAKEIQQWWVRDALPLIYGARADEWDEDVGLTLGEALEWKDQPASRALHFPLIFDGMELVEKHRDEIRDSTGLPDFNKRTLQTRLQP